MTDVAAGRAAQRRRTRKAIVDAAAALLAGGAEPSVADVARAADVSRRTVYMYFPTYEQLLLDATLGALNVDVQARLDALTSDDVHERLRDMIDAICGAMAESLPLGRKLIKLTVDAPPPADGAPKRGFRRIQWIEQTLEPLHGRLTRGRWESLVSALALVIGWEAFIVLADVRGLTPRQAQRLVTDTALAIVDAALAEGPQRN